MGRLRKEDAGTALFFEDTGIFSDRLIDEIISIGIADHLSLEMSSFTQACFLKTIDEDVGLWHWYNSVQVQHVGGYRVKGEGWDNLHIGPSRHLFFGGDADNVFFAESDDELHQMIRHITEHSGLLDVSTMGDLGLKLGSDVPQDILCKKPIFGDLPRLRCLNY